MLGAGMVLLAKLLHLWIPDVFAWAVSAFVSIFLFYEAPPRIASSWLMSAFCSLISAALVFVLCLII